MKDLSKSKHALVENEDAILSEEVCLFCLDVSGSMSHRLGDGSSTTRIAALRGAMLEFLSIRKKAAKNGSKDKVGVILFGTEGPEVKLIHDPMNSNLESLEHNIRSLRALGGTPMKEALDLAIEVLSRCSNAMFRVVLISDGEPLSQGRVISRAEKCFNDYGIVIDTVGVGSESDEDFLKEVANKGGGSFTSTSSADSLKNKFIEFERERELLLGSGILLLDHKG